MYDITKVEKQNFLKFKIAQILVYLTQGVGWLGPGPEPLTAERLQATYTADERRVIHSAVVDAVPYCHDLTGLDLFRLTLINPTIIINAGV